MKSLLIKTLEKVCPNNVYLQGTLNADEPYPTEFITFWTDDTNDNSFYDNETHSVVWDFSIVYYSSEPNLIDTKPRLILNELKKAGFIPQGIGSDIPSDVPSHTGWAMDVIYKEFIKETR